MTKWAVLLGLVGCASRQSPDPEPATATPAGPAIVTVTTRSDEARAAYDEALVAQDNFRTVSAVRGFEEALAHDGKFPLAKARLGALTPDNDGVALLREAHEDARRRKIPAAEQVLIEALLALAEGEQARSEALMEQVVELAPGEWRAHMQVGNAAYAREDYDRALSALDETVALQPDAGPAWNMLGYTRSALGNIDSAVEAFERYAEIAPEEANPHDSIGEVLLKVGRFDEAEIAFMKAVRIDGSFFLSWTGIAQARFLAGDWDGAFAAIERADEVVVRETDRVGLYTLKAWALAAKGQLSEARAELEAGAEAAKALELDAQYAFSACSEGRIAAFSGQWDDAITAYDACFARVYETGLEGGAALGLQTAAQLGKAHALASKGHVDEASDAMPDADAVVARQPGFETWVRRARAAIYRASGDSAAAIEELSGCGMTQHMCRHELAAAQEASGDEAGAEATRQALRVQNARDWDYVAVWMASER
ncbi:MAG: tetratricopeptide repeat protein [Myxococcota bacterium]